MAYSLASKIMVVNVSISMWEGRRLDRRVTEQTIKDQNVTDDDGLRVNKLLISKDAFKAVQASASAVRTFVREHTLPWKDNGDRALMRQGYQNFMVGFSQLKSEFDSAVDTFVTDLYPAEVAKASFRLGDAFNADDYPHPSDLSSRFGMTLDIDAVAEPEDFRVKLDEATVTEIQDGMREAIEHRVHKAMQDVWMRVSDMVEHFVSRTSPDAQRFYDTTVYNLRDIVDLLPALNLINDPNLKEMGKRLRDTLYGYDPQDIRKNKEVRAEANQQAQEIMEDMKSFMKAFGG